LIFYKKYGIIKWGIYINRTAFENLFAYAAPIVESYNNICGNPIKPFGTAIPHMPPHIAINSNSPPGRPLVKIFTKFAPWRNRIWPYIIKKLDSRAYSQSPVFCKGKKCVCVKGGYMKKIYEFVRLSRIFRISLYKTRRNKIVYKLNSSQFFMTFVKNLFRNFLQGR